MASLIAPPVSRTAPAVERTRYGLLSVASSADETSDRWLLGVEWESVSCLTADVAAVVCDVDYQDGWPLELNVGVNTVEVVPFLVLGSYECGAQSRPMAEAAGFARANLEAGEQRAIEFAVATGQGGAAPSFQGADDLTPAGGAVPVDEGFGILEGYLARMYGSVGAIHAPRRLTTAVSRLRAAERHGQRLETLGGTFVALGAGYDLANVGPDGSPPASDEAWLYATGRPVVRRGPAFILNDEATLNRDTNQVEVVAARPVAVGWDCATAAVLVDAPDGEPSP